MDEIQGEIRCKNSSNTSILASIQCKWTRVSVSTHQSRIKDGTEVLKKYDDNLLELVDKFLEEGFRIIIMGDFNMDARRNGRKHLINELKKRGIRERIMNCYGKESKEHILLGGQPHRWSICFRQIRNDQRRT